MADGDERQIRFRPLEMGDLPLMREWLNCPHVARWWPGWPTAEQVAAKYAPRIAGEDPTVRAYAIEYGARPIGYIQCYFDVAASPEFREHVRDADTAAGIDLFIGDRELIGCGLGSLIIGGFLREVVFANLSITSCVIDPAHNNRAAIRAYEKAGFIHLATITVPGELGPQRLMKIARSDFETHSRTQGVRP